jgi:hypothetical protein
LQERASVEQGYITQLERLSARLHASKDSVFSELDQFNLTPLESKLQLGQSLTLVLEALESEIAELAQRHSNWKHKLQQEVENPLRETLARTGGAWNQWELEENRLNGQVKEYESLVDKLSKVILPPSSSTLSRIPPH